MADDTEKLQVNVDFTPYPELYKQLEQMVADDMTDRSKFLRRLVSQEWGRRQQMSLPLSGTGTTGKNRKATPATAA